ncbi:MAG TPA: YceH family protein [Bryobacteraceae bacterium]|nr:YceH family protein [Bryobacteraceae bacterium]
MVTSVDPLHPVELRVLGALIEKDITTPEYYPLTVNSLQNACNQKSSRDPVVAYDEQTVEHALDLLKNKHLVTRISGAGHRVEKWAHRLGETLNLGRREMALLCVLMLRGAQTVGELRGRTERMHDFADLEEVERVLESLENLNLVARASRGRWVQLLGGTPEVEDNQPAAVVRTPLEEKVENIERELLRLKHQLKEKLGESFD